MAVAKWSNWDLRLWIVESAVRCLELSIIQIIVFFPVIQALVSVPFIGFVSVKPKRIYSVGALEELCICWINLCVLPAGVRPSARDKLKILLGDASRVKPMTSINLITTNVQRFASSLIATTIIENIILFLLILHSFFQINEQLHYS